VSFSIVEGDVVIRDSNGNPVGVILDGAIYRFAVDAKVTSSALPTGAATEATVATLLTEAEFEARVGTLGQKTMAGSTPVVIANDQSRVLVEATIADASGLAADTVKQGTRTAQAIEYPALLAMTKQVLDELKAIRLHLEQINEETDPL
jgi:hypothetical protein